MNHDLPYPPSSAAEWGLWLDHLTSAAADQLKTSGEVKVDYTIIPRKGDLMPLRAPDGQDEEIVKSS